MKFVSLSIIIILSCSNLFAQYYSLTHDDLDRTYLVHLPTNYMEGDSIPLMLAMHGGFGSAYNLQDQSQLSIKANQENFIVVYPEGIESNILNIRSWNAGWCCGYASNTAVDDVGFIDTLLDVLLDQYSIDPLRIYATGMSNGGFMSYRLACELSDRIAAIAPVACSMSITDCSPMRPVPIIQFHSYQDESVPYSGGIGSGPSDHHNPPQDSVLSSWADTNECLHSEVIIDNEEYTFTKWTNCACGTEIHHYITQDGGHSWPGGNVTAIGDLVSNHINANDLMWIFFQAHSLECNTISNNQYTTNNQPITIYPNPSSGLFTINLNEVPLESSINIMNQWGISLFMTNDQEIDLSTYPDGIYFISILSSEGLKSVRPLIKMD